MSAPAAPAAAAPKKGGSKLIPIILGVVVLAGGGGGAFWWTHRGAAVEAAEEGESGGKEAKAGKAAKAKAKAKKKGSEPGIVSFEPFVVNLADTNASRFLRASVQVVLSDPAFAAEVQEKKKVILMQMRAAILERLTAETSEHLATPEGKAALKKEIIEHLEPIVEETEVEDVLFSDFVIQF
jgi:flagellar FliL protein